MKDLTSFLLKIPSKFINLLKTRIYSGLEVRTGRIFPARPGPLEKRPRPGPFGPLGPLR